MPTYELCLVLRSLPRARLFESALRASGRVLSSGGVIRRVEAMAERELPQATHVHDEKHTRGVYLNVTCDLPVKAVPSLLEEYSRDTDILKKAFVGTDRYRTRPDPVCTLDQELLPPSRRPSVQRMVDEGRRPHRYRRDWVSKTGLDYYPFHK